MAYELVNVYAIRIAGVFMISTYTLAIRAGMFPGWMALLGYALVLLLLLSPGRFNWAPLVFPLSAFVISVYVLLANLGPKRRENSSNSFPSRGFKPRCELVTGESWLRSQLV